MDVPVGHVAAHVVVTVVTLGVTSIVLKRRTRTSTRAARVGRGAFLLGLAVLVLGQLLEIVGAFGYRGNERRSSLATVHDIGVPLTPVGMVALLAGAALWVGAEQADRASPGVRRWIIAAMAVSLVAIVLFVLGGIIFGY